MIGITRFDITNKPMGRGAYRFTESRARWQLANDLYRAIFATLGMPLASGEEDVKCSKDEMAARYDCEFGVDVLLRFDNGMHITMQEKFLYTKFKTVTVEYLNNPTTGDTGDWFDMRAQYYFVGYDQDKRMQWDRWIIINWPAAQMLTNQNKIFWFDNKNKRDGAKASFRYTYMDKIPDECIVASSYQAKFSQISKGQMGLV